MALAAFWKGDPNPHPWHHSPGFRAAQSDDVALIAQLAALAPAEVAAADETPVTGRISGPCTAQPAAYGWVADVGAEIGELGVSFVLPPGDRYLWDFKTLPDWRGRGSTPISCGRSSPARGRRGGSGSSTRRRTSPRAKGLRARASSRWGSSRSGRTATRGSYPLWPTPGPASARRCWACRSSVRPDRRQSVWRPAGTARSRLHGPSCARTPRHAGPTRIKPVRRTLRPAPARPRRRPLLWHCQRGIQGNLGVFSV